MMCALFHTRLSSDALNIVFSCLDKRVISRSLRDQTIAMEVWVAAEVLEITALARQAADAIIWNMTAENCLRTMLFLEQAGMPTGHRVTRCARVRVAKNFLTVSRSSLFRDLDRAKKQEIVVLASRYLNQYNTVDVFLHAVAYSEPEAKRGSLHFIAGNFSKVSSTPAFALLPKHCLFAVLKSPLLRAEKQCITNAVMFWAQRDVPGFTRDVDDLLEFVRYKFNR